MGTAGIPSRDTPPVFQFAECIASYQRKMLYFWFFGVVDCHPLGSQRFPQSTRVRTSVCQKRTDIGKEVLENGCTFVVADLPFSQQKQDGPPVAVISGMKFGIQSSFCATDETWRIPFLSRIAAVR